MSACTDCVARGLASDNRQAFQSRRVVPVTKSVQRRSPDSRASLTSFFRMRSFTASQVPGPAAPPTNLLQPRHFYFSFFSRAISRPSSRRTCRPSDDETVCSLISASGKPLRWSRPPVFSSYLPPQAYFTIISCGVCSPSFSSSPPALRGS